MPRPYSRQTPAGQPTGPWSSRLRTGACEMQKDSSQPMDSSMNQLINASIQPSVLPSADLPSVYSSIVCVPACPSMHPAAHLATHTSACPPITHPSTHPPIIHPALQPLTPTSSAKTGFTFLREWRMFSRGALSTSSSTTGRVFRVRERRGKGLPRWTPAAGLRDAGKLCSFSHVRMTSVVKVCMWASFPPRFTPSWRRNSSRA